MTTREGAVNGRALASTVGRFSVLPANVCNISSVGVEDEEMTIGDIGVIVVLSLLVLLVVTATAIFSVTALDNWLDGIISRKIKKMIGE